MQDLEAKRLRESLVEYENYLNEIRQVTRKNVEALDVIQKYASSEAKQPKLNKLGTTEWEKTKTKVKSAVYEVAKDLVELYAIRADQKGYAYKEDTVWQREFEELFPYEETQDQLLACAILRNAALHPRSAVPDHGI